MLKDIGVDRAEGGVRPVLEPVRKAGQDLPLEVRPGMGRGHGTDMPRMCLLRM
jgi:hypothetical protein